MNSHSDDSWKASDRHVHLKVKGKKIDKAGDRRKGDRLRELHEKILVAERRQERRVALGTVVGDDWKDLMVLRRDMITCWIIKILRLPKNTVLTADHWRSWRQYVLDPKEELVRRLGLPAHEILGLCDFKIWDAYNRAAHEATPEEIASAVKNEILVYGDKVNHLYAILPKIAQ